MPKIPTACITVEDAEMMSRIASRGNRIVIHLKMGARNYPDADSFNTVAEIIGSKYPEQVCDGKGWAIWAQGFIVEFQFSETVWEREHESAEMVLVDPVKIEISMYLYLSISISIFFPTKSFHQKVYYIN